MPPSDPDAAPGRATDALVRASFSIERREPGCIVVETPERRDYWFGNLLALDVRPPPADYELWLARHAEFFAGTGAKKRVVQWEVSGARDDPPRPPRPEVDLDVLTVLVSDATPHAVSRDDVTIRELTGEADWSDVDSLERTEAEGAPPGFADFYAWRTRMVRRDVENGRASVYGAFADEGLLVAFAGCYACERWIRLTTPVTAKAYRRRGFFSALFSRAVRDARTRVPGARIVVVAEADGPPERLYRSLGFSVSGYQYALVER